MQSCRHPLVHAGLCLFLAAATTAADDAPAIPSPPADAAPAIPPPPADATPLAVQRIADTGAVVLPDRAGDRTVALADVAVPEDDTARERARRFLEQLLLGEQVVCVVQLSPADGDKTSADRELVAGHLYRWPDGLYVNLELIRQGYAGIGEQAAGERLSLFRHYEKIARERQKGIWSPSSPSASPTAPRASDNRTNPPAPEPGDGRPPTTSGGGAAPKTGGGDAAANRVDLRSITVYITKSGKKYHRQDCQHVRKSAQAISLEDALKKGYEPCKRCNPPTKEKPAP